jgi:hypothetical protein
MRTPFASTFQMLTAHGDNLGDSGLEFSIVELDAIRARAVGIDDQRAANASLNIPGPRWTISQIWSERRPVPFFD